jgi:hypothetical protein
VKQAIFHPEARAEMREAVEFYEARLDGLGLRFLSSRRVDSGSDFRASGGRHSPWRCIAKADRSWVSVQHHLSCLGSYIYLVAIAHQHRRPGY